MAKMNEYPFLRSKFNFSAETITQKLVNVCLVLCFSSNNLVLFSLFL